MHRGEWAADSGNGRKWEAGKRVEEEEEEEGEFKPAFETSQTPYSDLAYLLSRSTIDRWLLTKERLSLLLPSLSPRFCSTCSTPRPSGPLSVLPTGLNLTQWTKESPEERTTGIFHFHRAVVPPPSFYAVPLGDMVEVYARGRGWIG